MKLPIISTDDKHWVVARLRANLQCMIGIGLLCAVIQSRPPVSIEPTTSVVPIRTVSISDAGTKTVLPVGWRRTKDGWEHVSTWPSFGGPTASINELIAQQHDREPLWMRTAMARISRVPPLMVALIQITAIAAIVFVAESRRRDVRKTQ